MRFEMLMTLMMLYFPLVGFLEIRLQRNAIYESEVGEHRWHVAIVIT